MKFMYYFFDLPPFGGEPDEPRELLEEPLGVPVSCVSIIFFIIFSIVSYVYIFLYHPYKKLFYMD